MENAEVIFRNFEGKEGPYNQKGDRNFCVLLDDETAEKLRTDGWNVKGLRSREEGDPDQPYLPVAVSYKHRPPKIVLITYRGQTGLDEDTCEFLDMIDLEVVDIIINPYNWSVSGKSGIKAYLTEMYATMKESPLDVKYRDVPEIGAPATRLELESPVVQLEVDRPLLKLEIEKD